MILAARGLLDNHIPKEFTPLLTSLKIAGVDLEIESDFYHTMLDIHLTTKSEKGIEENRKHLFKLYFPDVKDSSETLMEEGIKLFKDPNTTMRMGATDKKKKINPLVANSLLNKKRS